ncbi:hypothetical protein ES703_12958 [subsurface metagenome]
MMYDRWEYTIPADKADVVRVKCYITKGFLHSLIMYFPPGTRA